VKAELTRVRTDATTLVAQVKGELASETNAIKSSAASLESAVKGLTSNPSVAQLGAVKTAASSVASSVKSFVGAATAKCS
jgi:hypothetical protein